MAKSKEIKYRKLERPLPSIDMVDGNTSILILLHKKRFIALVNVQYTSVIYYLNAKMYL